MRFYGKSKVYKFTCNSCSHEFVIPVEKIRSFSGKVIVTSAVARFPINHKFLSALKKYSEFHNAELVILPVNHGLPFSLDDYDDEIQQYILSENATVKNTLIAGSNILGATLESPLHGMNGFSKGKNIVFGHPQVQLKTLPRKNEPYPPILTTTGTISVARYGQNKTAQKANFNHSFSAVIISDSVIRHLNFDGTGFYDLDKYVTEDEVTENNNIEALITGDEHVIFFSDSVFNATYGVGGIVDKLKPKMIFRHDVLDCHSISHHHRNNPLVKYSKFITNTDSILEELGSTLDFIVKTTPETTISYIIPSNHNSHLEKWLNEADPKHDPVNAKLYYYLMWVMIDYIDKHNGEIGDPFNLWATNYGLPENVKFLSRNESFFVKDVDVNNHGDHGVNGARGTRQSFRELGNKSIIGHSHSPGIEKGCYQVGTSSKLRLDYNKGLSSWHNCHCIIHQNGKRQLVFIENEKWE